MPEKARGVDDAHAVVRRLTAEGLPETHAETVVRERIYIIEHGLATKTDVADFRADIETLRSKTSVIVETAKRDIMKWVAEMNTALVLVVLASLLTAIEP